MELILDRDVLLKSLSHAYGVVEKKKAPYQFYQTY